MAELRLDMLGVLVLLLSCVVATSNLSWCIRCSQAHNKQHEQIVEC
jgi:hypothetical protein